MGMIGRYQFDVYCDAHECHAFNDGETKTEGEAYALLRSEGWSIERGNTPANSGIRLKAKLTGNYIAICPKHTKK